MNRRPTRRGDVWWFEPPEMKRRPVVILTRDQVIPHLNQLLAAPAAGRIRSIPSGVELDETDGMPARCAISLDNVLLARPAFLAERVTHLDPVRMVPICRALANAVAC